MAVEFEVAGQSGVADPQTVAGPEVAADQPVAVDPSADLAIDQKAAPVAELLADSDLVDLAAKVHIL